VVGYSRLAGADEERVLARLRALRSDLIDPTIAVHHGRIVKRTGDGSIIARRPEQLPENLIHGAAAISL
jgi:adenylate cyclase